MNRRGFFGRVAGASAVAAIGLPEAVQVSPTVAIEPVPTTFTPLRERWPSGAKKADPDPETLMVDGDLSSTMALQALVALGWEPRVAPVPVLCCQPDMYLWAREIEREFDGGLSVHCARFGDPDGAERHTWFVVWRGARMGSNGA